jgi:hypothetical protein
MERKAVAEPVFLSRLRDHFGKEPSNLPVVAEAFESADHTNLHLAIQHYLCEPGRSSELLGVVSAIHFFDFSLSQLVAPVAAGIEQPQPLPGPVRYVSIKLQDDTVIACVQHGLFLIQGDQPLAVLVRGPNEMGNPKIQVEVMAEARESAERFLADLRMLIRKRNVYRGQVLSLGINNYGAIEVHFHTLAQIERDHIILPVGLLDRIERETVGFSRHSEKLRAAGRHLRRGILLHGAPGTGKTLTVMYLACRMRNRTVLILTGRGMGLVAQSCAMARALQPSMVILEDVDLIAEERTHPTMTWGPLLFELLNQMDGLADDADIMFLLTTNRPDLLEPALAARPGRIDQAIEIPLPDAACRLRLFEFYGRGLELRLTHLDRFVERTEGASAAFIRELIRKAALIAADEQGEFVVEDRHLDDALNDLVLNGGELTRRLLGAQGAKPPQARR